MRHRQSHRTIYAEEYRSVRAGTSIESTCPSPIYEVRFKLAPCAPRLVLIPRCPPSGSIHQQLCHHVGCTLDWEDEDRRDFVYHIASSIVSVCLLSFIPSYSLTDVRSLSITPPLRGSSVDAQHSVIFSESRRSGIFHGQVTANGLDLLSARFIPARCCLHN